VEWLEVVDEVAGAVPVLVEAAVVDRAGWAVPLLPALVAIAPVPVAGIKSRIR
jgi:hypothetical protein